MKVPRTLPPPALLLLGLLLFTPGSGRGWAAASRPPLDLVRLEFRAPGDLEAFTALGAQVYTRLPGENGAESWLVALNASQQERILGEGLFLQVLDADIRGKVYFLFGSRKPGEPPPDNLPVAILLQKPGYAVGRASPAEAERLPGLGLEIRRLWLHPALSQVGRKTSAWDPVTTPDPLIQTMIDQVDPDAARGYVAELSGETPVTVNGNPYTFLTRYTRAYLPIKKATRFVFEHFESLGLQTDYLSYDLPGSGERRNVIGEQTGVSQPDRIILLTAHLDDYSQIPYDLAPGADDNASGSAGVLLAADVLSQYEFGCTLRYILFTGEEQGHYGSQAYAAQAFAQGENIEAVLNLDMLGYNSDASPVIELHTRPNDAGDLAIATLFEEVVSTYGLDLVPQVVDDGLSWSDHASFWDYGYPALLSMEDFQDFTPYYHQSTDQLDSLDVDYLTAFVQAAVGTLAYMGCGEVDSTPTPSASVTIAMPPSLTLTPTPPAVYGFNGFLPLIQKDHEIPPTTTPTATPTDTPTPAACGEGVANGGFESDAAWELPATLYPAAYTTANPHSGNRSMRVGILIPAEDRESYSSARQAVTLPAGAIRATLGVWLYPWTGDLASARSLPRPRAAARQDTALQEDAQYALVLDADYQWIGTLWWELSNGRQWEFHTFDLSAYAGRTIYLHFGAYNNGQGGVTGMYVDDVSLEICAGR